MNPTPLSWRGWAATCLVIATGACSSVETINERAMLAESDARIVDDPAAHATFFAPVRGEYRIGPRDLIEIEVYELEEPNQSKLLRTRVSENGNVVLPLIGAVAASGKSTRELQQQIEARLAAEYLVNPSASVLVIEYRARSVTVLGAVESPGTYHLEENSTTLVDALALAGGATDVAGTEIVVMRSPGHAGHAADASTGAVEPMMLKIDLGDLVERGDLRSNCVLEDGDVVHVPPVPVFFVTGHVHQPGAFPLRGKITVLRAVAMAGGLSEDATPSSTLLIRRDGERRTTIPIHLGEIARGSDGDLEVKPDDVLVIGQSPTKNFFSSIGSIFRGLFHFGYGIN